MYHILLVDDEAQEREGIEFLIRKYQLPLIPAMAVNGQKASEYMKEHKVDILFTDVKMPFKDGLTLAAETYAASPSIKIIIFSAYGEFEYAKRAMEAHAVDYLLKPIELDEFEKIMKKVISQLDEERRLKEYENERRETDRKRLLYKVFTGGSLTEEEKRQLDIYINDRPGVKKQIISLEADSRLFERKEEEIHTLIHTYLKLPLEYVNLYPDSSALLILDRKNVSSSDLKVLLEKLQRDVSMLYEEKITVVLTGEFQTADQMLVKIDDLNSFLKEIYGGNGNLIFLPEIVRSSDYYASEVEQLKTAMMEAIGARDKDAMILYADQLIQTMEKNHVVSRIYVHHVFYDIIEAFYEKYGIRDRKRIFEKVERLLSNKDSTRLLTDFREVLSEVLAEQSQGLSDSKGVADAIKAVIAEEFSRDISLMELAERVNLAPSYVSFLFKKETGSNLVKYLTDYRMEMAKRFLDGKEMKIIQVGKACGYENQPYFNRLFKNYYGVTPKQYREQR